MYLKAEAKKVRQICLTLKATHETKQRQSKLNGKTQLQANLPEAKGQARDKAADAGSCPDVNTALAPRGEPQAKRPTPGAAPGGQTPVTWKEWLEEKKVAEPPFPGQQHYNRYAATLLTPSD